MNPLRKPAVAGQFYPAGAAELSATVTTLLDEAGERGGPAPKALIVPHAGYVYSGPVAASAYARLRPYRDRYTRVVLVGPCHRVPVSGLATCSADAFRTPLGEVAVDREAVAGLEDSELSHRHEHCLEVHLPFLQTVLGEFAIVPVVVGEARAAKVATMLESLWGGPETLIVISSDLSHYLPYDSAVTKDAATCRAIEALDTGFGHDSACGATPVRGLLLVAKRKGLNIETLDLRNSGDTSGDRDYVVGYGAWALH